MEYKVSYNYHLGRALFSVAAIYIGIQVFTSGHEFYSPYWHALRKTVYPDSKNKIEGMNMSFDELNRYATLAMGVLLVLGGALTLLNQRINGPLLIIASVLMMMVTQDNPWIRDQVKPKPKTTHIRYNDFFRHLTLIGSCLYIMVTPPAEDEEEPAKDDGKVKKD